MLLSIPQAFSLGYCGGLVVEIGASVTWKRLENQRYPQHSRSFKTCIIVCRLGSYLSKARNTLYWASLTWRTHCTRYCNGYMIIARRSSDEQEKRSAPKTRLHHVECLTSLTYNSKYPVVLEIGIVLPVSGRHLEFSGSSSISRSCQTLYYLVQCVLEVRLAQHNVSRLG